MNEKLVSIVTPTYNCANYIGETIESVMKQTYRNWELIIIDDCSKDNTRKIVDKYLREDPRIMYILLNENSGAAVARTKAISIAHGAYIAFIDSDDIWYPKKLELQIKWMEINNHVFSCTSYEQIDEKGISLNKVVKSIVRTDYNRLLLDCPVGNSSVIYNVDALGKFVVPDIKKRNDDSLWLQILKKEKYIWGMPEILMKYRVRKDSISSNKLKLIKYHWILYREIEELSVFRSLFHILYWGLLKLLRIK